MDNMKQWLTHVSKEFFPLWKQSFSSWIQQSIKPVSEDCYLISLPGSEEKETLKSSHFVRFCFPVQHMWPTKIDATGFVEKCAQGLLKQFSQQRIANIIVYSLDKKKKNLASNVRGRALQLFAEQNKLMATEKERAHWTKNPTTQPAQNLVLIVSLGDKCVYAGISSLAQAGSVFGGGRHYVGVSHEDIASRAASKFVEASEILRLQGIKTAAYTKWLELGCAPGGVTYELAQRGHEVIAVDKAALSERVLKNPKVHFFQMDAREVKLTEKVQALFCDMNGPAILSAEIAAEKSSFVEKEGLVIHTFKIHQVQTFESEFKSILETFQRKKLNFLFARHMYNNKQEITLFFIKK